MTGGFLQLVAKNYDDLYLTTSPQVTLFKIVYRRYTNFSLYDEDILIKSGGNFSSKTTIKLKNNADLLHKLYVVIDLPKIKISKKKPTFKDVKSFLKKYGVTWNYPSSVNDNNTVTIDYYDLSAGEYSIANSINKRITHLTNIYNLLNNGAIMANDQSEISNIGGIGNLVLNPLTRLQDLSGSFIISNQSKYNEIQTELINGKTCTNELLYRMFSFYSTDYGNLDIPVLQCEFLSSVNFTQTLTYPTTKNLSLYESDIQSTLLETGILIGALKAYSKDTILYNANYSYNNSGSILSGNLSNISSSGTGNLYKNVIYNVTITNAVISGSTITNGNIIGTFVDPLMSGNTNMIDNLILTNVTISTVDDEIYTNYVILNASITLNSESIDNISISGTIINGTLIKSTVNNVIINDAVFTLPTITDGIVSIPTIDATLINDGSILMPLATLIDSNNIKTQKTLYNCLFQGGNLNASTTTTTRSIISGTEAYVVFIDAQIINATKNGNTINGGTVKFGTLIENNVSFSTNISNAILLNASVKLKTSTITTIYDITDVILSNISIIENNLSIATIVSGTIKTNVVKNATVTSVIKQDQYLTNGVLTGGTMYNYEIQDINIESGILPNSFLTNATLIDSSGFIYSNVNLDNLNLSYVTNITNAIITNNTTNLIDIPDIAVNSFDNQQSNPLFGKILKRNSISTDSIGLSTIFSNDSPSIIKLQLYNADDFRYITYMTYLNNIIRIKPITSNDIIEFNPNYSSFYQENLTISSENLNILTPDLLSLDESILFYHTLDPNTTQYNVENFNKNDQIKIFFNNIHNKTYDIINQYNNIIPVIRDDYKNTDAHMIYTKYINYLM